MNIAYVVMVEGRGLPTRWLTRTEAGLNVGHGDKALFSKGMVENVLRVWRTRANCVHLTFTKVRIAL